MAGRTPACPCQQGNSISWPCQLLLVLRGPSEPSLPPQEPGNSGFLLWVSLARCIWGCKWVFSACGL